MMLDYSERKGNRVVIIYPEGTDAEELNEEYGKIKSPGSTVKIATITIKGAAKHGGKKIRSSEKGRVFTNRSQ